MFRFLLALENGEPADPAVLVTMVPDWQAGDTIRDRGREGLPRVGVDLRELHTAEPEITGLLVVEPL